MSTTEAIAALGLSRPTVIALAEAGELPARREPWGTRFKWRLERAGVEAYVTANGRGRRSSAVESRLSDLEARLELIVGERGESQTPSDDEVADLRARLVDRDESAARYRVATDAMAQADAERAEVVRLLLEALQAAERADSHRRDAIANLGEALAGYDRPGHPGQLR